MARRSRRALGIVLCALPLLAACTSAPAPGRVPPPATTTAGPQPTVPAAAHWTPGAPATIATGLDAPWSVVALPDGGALISERDTARIREHTAAGVIRDVGVVPGVVAGGEGGLLGLALHRDGAASWLYAMYTAVDDNRVVRMLLRGHPGSHTLGEPEVILDGIARARNHNGGRIAFGPDGMLYVATGDAGETAAAQHPVSLNGKILRLTPTGEPAPGNPDGTAVYTLGHRNVQGLAWTADGRMWASEFGQNTWDELNLIVAGANYGWPAVEGIANDARFADPVVQWRTDEASPSGIAAVGDTVFVAGLRGERLWVVDTADGAVVGQPRAALTGEQGRLRDAVAAPDGSLWVLTNNTDGRGDPRQDDDLLLRLSLTAR